MSVRDDIYFIKVKLTDSYIGHSCFFSEGDLEIYQCPFSKIGTRCIGISNLKKCYKLLQDYVEEFKPEIFDELL